MSNRPLIVVLMLLVAADCVLTTFAVRQMGATELNPICGWTGVDMFILLKVIVSAVLIGWGAGGSANFAFQCGVSHPAQRESGE